MGCHVIFERAFRDGDGTGDRRVTEFAQGGSEVGGVRSRAAFRLRVLLGQARRTLVLRPGQWRTGCEGRISYLKPRIRLDRPARAAARSL